MWSYYGSKTNMVDLYSPPKHDLIIEPFSGAAKYSMKYWDRDVLLVDKYEVVIRIWKWLQQCSPDDILKLPSPKTGEKIRDYNLDCEEAYLFMGFIIGAGGQSPRNTVSPNCERLRPNRIRTLLSQHAADLHKIRHWKIELGDYRNIPNQPATWFIDPPYQHGGHIYVESNKRIDFAELGDYCQTRQGQVIVCENTKADWLPFKPMKPFKGSVRMTTEAIWSNEPTNFDYLQQTLF